MFALRLTVPFRNQNRLWQLIIDGPGFRRNDRKMEIQSPCASAPMGFRKLYD